MSPALSTPRRLEDQPVDATPLAIRAAGPADVPALQAFVRSLSVTSRAQRFFVPVAELPPMLAEALRTRDPRHRFIVAEAVAGNNAPDVRTRDAATGNHPLVAMAQYARDALATAVCDIALVVADEWQGHGVGRTLLQRLLMDARRDGLAAAAGEVLRHNRPMLALARGAGFSLQRHPDDATLVRISRSLS